MVVWLRPEYILAFVTSLYYCSQLVLSKTYEKFWCTTEEGIHQLSCTDETALLIDITISKVYRRTQMCEPDIHSEYLLHCQSYIDGSSCEGNKTCSIEISSRDYIQCEDKTYTPTYFFVKYTCTQIHTMCTDAEPIRNTLHGYIISPAYPHPMADNLKCSITIEADPSMYIELSPIQVHLQEAIKCRGEYIEIFGYDPSFNENNINKNNNWKEYHTWCGADHSVNNPLPNARYLISSNSLYMSLQTTVSRDPRYFKIRYRVVPVIARSQYNSDGIVYDSLIKEHKSSLTILTTTIMSTKTINVLWNNSDVKNVNETLTKQTFKKGILIGIIAVVIVLLIAILAGILIFILIKRRRSSSPSNTRKKNVPSTTNNTITSKPTAKSSDKAPLLEKINNTSANVTKQRLVPERTVQISDVSTSRFKSSASTGTKPGLTKTEVPPSKPTLTAVDSGIYGVDLSEDITPVSKPVSLSTPNPSKIHTNILSDASESASIVVVNPLTENSTISPATIFSNDVVERNSLSTNENEEKEILLDHTVQSAYPHLVDIASSESDATLYGSGLQSKRTSIITKQPLVIQESNNIETIVLSDDTQLSSYHPIPFNPLHVILQKDANKYYTTEYI
ncbi:unnamed protein product [Rotaria sordida]|uniref:CUB domain-containing protein n=2 Tax=Rotaria sordida TaxID=392033 RepID=A0A813S145_9BILA|nr:unnamed protein product [Rotaria sordida]